MGLFNSGKKIPDQPTSAGEVVFDHQEKIREISIEHLAKYIRDYEFAVKRVGYSQDEVDDYLDELAGNIEKYISGNMSIDEIDFLPDFTEDDHGYSKKETNSLVKSLQAKLQQAKQEQMRKEVEIRKCITERLGPNATFLDEIVATTIEVIAAEQKAEQERKKQEWAKKQEKLNQIKKQLTPILPRFWPDIDNAIRERAKSGKTSIKVYPEEVDSSKKSVERGDGYDSDILYIRMLPQDADSDHKTVARELIIKHYEDEGFENVFDSIKWPSEDKETIEARAAKKAEWEAECKAKQILLAARIASVQSAKVISSFVSVEGSNGNMTNYIMHTVRLTYKDGTKGLISIRESDPFFQGIIEKLEN